ncbi:MAG: 1-deoxy-D-xylulose-5-phosphate synthase [Phycisphaerae bacterium]|nr:1-deoxy-D-xylulose-5-phosphate synthase [Phycisphaerae bacterium]
MSILDRIHGPADLRELSNDELHQLAGEIRERIIAVVGKNGGHLASNLGVTEITIALHRCFDFTQDRLLWDVGHQCYPHKLLTGRNPQFETLRRASGISGFPSRQESQYDLFNVGHAGTAIATAVGLARGDQALGRNARTVALVGDASIVNGLSFEGLNQAGLLKRQFLVILNDNEWGIAPTQGSFAKHLAKFRASYLYEEAKERATRYLKRVPVVGQTMVDAIEHLKEGIKATVSPHQIFEQLGFMYAGPIDGHDLPHLIDLLNYLKDVQHPVLLHIHTSKGKGCDFASAEPGRFHSPKPFTVLNGKVNLQKGTGKSWTTAFSEALIDIAQRDEKVWALTAAMPDGTGLDKFAEALPDRYIDVGIAESCAVDVAAGMARSGLRPVVAVYSTFMQRAFDQVFQEVVLQELPVVLCMDRAGLVGGDGAVHHGALDIAYLRGFPGMVLLAPADEPELRVALEFALRHNRPCALRYPRDNVPEPFGAAPPFELGRARTLREGHDAIVIGYGATVAHAMDASELLAADGVEIRVINARFARPIDEKMVADVLTSGLPVITAEDHALAGGFGSAVLETAQRLGLRTDRLVRLGLPDDRFVKQGSRAGQLAECGIDAAGIAAAVLTQLDEPVQRRVPTTVEPLSTATTAPHQPRPSLRTGVEQ